jgi:hypothetical protein
MSSEDGNESDDKGDNLAMTRQQPRWIRDVIFIRSAAGLLNV